MNLREHGTKKAGKEHLYYIPDSIEHLKAWVSTMPENQEYIYPELAKAYTGEHNRSSAYSQFKNFLAKCKVDDGFHSFRVSWATLSRSGGASVEKVQAGLGHSNQKVTDGYLQEDAYAIKQRLISYHHALPLAGGNNVDTIVKMVKEAYNRLSKAEKKELLNKFRELD